MAMGYMAKSVTYKTNFLVPLVNLLLQIPNNTYCSAYLHGECLREPPDGVLAAAVCGQPVDPDQRRLRRHEHDDALAGLLLDQKIALGG